ncbi:hypothetical protein T190611E02C_20256 [Tenacibaculum sp. 190524A05c]
MSGPGDIARAPVDKAKEINISNIY